MFMPEPIRVAPEIQCAGQPSWALGPGEGPVFTEAQGTPMGIWSSWEGKKGKMMEKLPTRVQSPPRSWVPKTITSTVKCE